MSLQKNPFGGKTLNDPIAAVKRKLFLGGTPVGILTMTVVWWIGLQQNDLSSLNLFSLPFLAISFLVLVLLLWRNTIHLRTFELSVYTLVLAYSIGDFAWIILQVILTNGSFTTDLTLWIPFVYILGFLFLSTNRALWLSALFFLSTLLLGLAACLHSLLDGLALQNIVVLIQVYFANALYIAVLYLVARIKERYTSEHAVADDMAKLAMTDSLTQIYNRRQLSQYLGEEVNRAERHNLPLSVLLFDLDWFKKINDTLGHNTGDEVLQEVARLLRQNIRTSDPFGRWGGDEFLCLATNTAGEQALELAERLRVVIQQHQFKGVGKITSSFGVTSYQRGDGPETLIRRADLGLYKAKSDGRNRVEVIKPGVTLPLFEGEKPYSTPTNKSGLG